MKDISLGSSFSSGSVLSLGSRLAHLAETPVSRVKI